MNLDHRLPTTKEEQAILDSFSEHLDRHWLNPSLNINPSVILVRERILYLVSLDIPAHRFFDGFENLTDEAQTSINYQHNNVCREAADFVQTGDPRILDFSNREKRNSARGRQRLRSRSPEKISIEAAEDKFGFPFISRFFHEERNKKPYYHASTIIGRKENGVYEEFYKHGTGHCNIADVELPTKNHGFTTFEPILR